MQKLAKANFEIKKVADATACLTKNRFDSLFFLGQPKFLVELPNIHQIVNKVFGRNLWLKISCVEKHSCRILWLKAKNVL